MRRWRRLLLTVDAVVSWNLYPEMVIIKKFTPSLSLRGFSWPRKIVNRKKVRVQRKLFLFFRSCSGSFLVLARCFVGLVPDQDLCLGNPNSEVVTNRFRSLLSSFERHLQLAAINQNCLVVATNTRIPSGSSPSALCLLTLPPPIPVNFDLPIVCPDSESVIDSQMETKFEEKC